MNGTTANSGFAIPNDSHTVADEVTKSTHGGEVSKQMQLMKQR